MNAQRLKDLGGGSSSGLLAHRAALVPDKVALLFEDEQWTYRELDDAATRFAAGLLGLGLAKGDRVATFLNNRSEYLTTGIGGNRAGVVGVPVNNAFRADFLRAPLERTAARLVVTESALADAMLSLGTLPASVETLVFVDEVPDKVPAGARRVLSLRELETLGRGDPAFPEVGPHDVNAILFTSGTTGRSKGVLCPNLMALTMAKEHVDVFEITPRDRMLTCFPMYHGMAQVVTCLAAVYAGATAVLRPGFSLSTFWDEVRRYEATQFNALGVVLNLLLAMPESDRDRDHAVTRVFSAPAPPDALYRFETRFGVHLIEGYGSTEVKNIMYNPWRSRRIGSMGLPTPTSIVEVHDEHGDRVQPGQVGEIVYRPREASIMNAGYLDDPQATLAAMRGLWWHTGDMGSTDDDGYFYFHDRASDSLRRRGENISSTEVEEVLATFPGVQVAAAIRAQSELGEHEVLAVRQRCTRPFEFRRRSRCGSTARRKCRVSWCPDMCASWTRCPSLATGKVRKVELRDEGITADTWDSVAAGCTVPKQGRAQPAHEPANDSVVTCLRYRRRPDPPHPRPWGETPSWHSLDALGITGVIIDEFWGVTPEFRVLPGDLLADGLSRPLSPTAQAMSIELSRPGLLPATRRTPRPAAAPRS